MDRCYIRLIAGIVCAFVCTSAFAQDSPPPDNPPEPESHGARLHWHELPKNILHDEKAIFFSPFDMDRHTAKQWALIGMATAALISTDRTVSDRLPETRAQLTVSRWASRMGADYSIYPLTFAFYVVGKAENNPRSRDTARISIEALADAEITVNILKLATQRPRPEKKGASVAFWSGGDAFPSGHSIKSWALARVVAREYSHRTLVPVLAYGFASSVSVARVAGRRHSPSDALAGAAMGFFIGDYVYRHHHAPSEKAGTVSWIVDHVDFRFGTIR